jgi:hypothetical protein
MGEGPREALGKVLLRQGPRPQLVLELELVQAQGQTWGVRPPGTSQRLTASWQEEGP